MAEEVAQASTKRVEEPSPELPIKPAGGIAMPCMGTQSSLRPLDINLRYSNFLFSQIDSLHFLIRLLIFIRDWKKHKSQFALRRFPQKFRAVHGTLQMSSKLQPISRPCNFHYGVSGVENYCCCIITLKALKWKYSLKIINKLLIPAESARLINS